MPRTPKGTTKSSDAHCLWPRADVVVDEIGEHRLLAFSSTPRSFGQGRLGGLKRQIYFVFKVPIQ